MSTINKRLGENLKELRVTKNLSQSELADMVSVDKSYISNIENGKTNPTTLTLEKIATALKIEISELLK